MTAQEPINRTSPIVPTSTSDWVDRGTYWVNTAPQGSERWKQLRNRVTASNFGTATGGSQFKTPTQLALSLAGIAQEPPTPKAVHAMQHGVKTEPIARDWYCRTRGVQVEEVGLAVPKWDPEIGASLDGDVIGTEGIIEIKCPEKMYRPLDEYIVRTHQGWQPPMGYHDHIWQSHYDQMQGGMAICGKKWCDYIVYCTTEGRAFVDRVLFNKAYWEQELYPKLRRFIEHELRPLLREAGQTIEIPH